MSLEDTIALHGAWLRGQKRGVRADLRDADVRGALFRAMTQINVARGLLADQVAAELKQPEVSA